MGRCFAVRTGIHGFEIAPPTQSGRKQMGQYFAVQTGIHGFEIARPAQSERIQSDGFFAVRTGLLRGFDGVGGAQSERIRIIVFSVVRTDLLSGTLGAQSRVCQNVEFFAAWTIILHLDYMMEANGTKIYGYFVFYIYKNINIRKKILSR